MPTAKNRLCVICNHADRYPQAKQFAERYGYALSEQPDDDYILQLRFDADHLCLFDTELDTGIHVDFLHGATAHREKFGGGKGQAIAKAIGLNKMKQPTVLDITAGLARDAYVLATLGCQLILVEQSPVLYALIDDAIQRALADTDGDHSVKNLTRLINADSLTVMQQSDIKPDVIYFDPMYPERKKSALVKKDMQILHKLIGTGENFQLSEQQLLATALQHAARRVVVKRPAHADAIGDTAPTMSIASKKTRYDVYVTHA